MQAAARKVDTNSMDAGCNLAFRLELDHEELRVAAQQAVVKSQGDASFAFDDNDVVEWAIMLSAGFLNTRDSTLT